MICSHPIFEKTRIIENNQQHYLEHERKLKLFEEEIVAPNETFLLLDVRDVSYKSFSESYGFLYLHTSRGVRAFMVKEEPKEWMEELRTRLSNI
ncbi:hypothetical protein SAMN04487936_10389 [Halobacillus dabanensis]|uniref:PH domain-containing protein n=1 Tax=Halobacillus dabanensis TaxID=240302 RepID=A0A1I3SWI9_HALDA|nr:hypothetical protein SAMN04487936_10389 [Halobacillus dabanensis]